MLILQITTQTILYGILIAIVLINLSCIAFLVIKERKSDKEEIEDLVASIAKAKPREDVKEEIKEENPLELEKVIEAMQKDLEATPEDVVSNFEKDQEEKAIISYQELVSSLKSEEPIKEEIKEVLKDPDVIDIDEETEEKEEKTEEVVEEKETSDEENKIEEKEEDKKFKNTDFISPVYGKVDSKKVEYPTVPKISREAKLGKMLNDNSKKLEETLDLGPLKEEIRKNDEFLRALKDFRSNL